jgi:hypothetical protein
MIYYYIVSGNSVSEVWSIPYLVFWALIFGVYFLYAFSHWFFEVRKPMNCLKSLSCDVRGCRVWTCPRFVAEYRNLRIEREMKNE